MGISIARKSCDLEMPAHVPPDYYILKGVYHHGHTILKVWYRRATNCGGHKILVLPGRMDNLGDYPVEDPHFADEGGPIARFHPSQDGWENAIRFVETL